MTLRDILPAVGIAALALAAGVYLAPPAEVGRVVYAPPALDGGPYWDRVVRYHQRADGLVPSGAILLLGDSITAGIPAPAVAPCAVNFGIGGDTSVGLLRRLPAYESASRARAVVVAVGVNDVVHGAAAGVLDNLAAILAAIPEHTPVVLSAILPVDESKLPEDMRDGVGAAIRRVTGRLPALVEGHPTRVVVDAGPALAGPDGRLRPEMHVGDGVHLSPAGAAIWIDALRGGLSAVMDSPPSSARCS